MTEIPKMPTASLTVNGRTYDLIWRTNHLCALQKRTGVPLGVTLRQIAELSLSDLVQLVYTLLQDQYANEIMSLEAAGNLIDAAGGYNRVIPVITEMIVTISKQRDAILTGA
jgi:hypothetical protein